MPRQFIACKFRTEDRKSYTYHNDGEPVAVGDQVKVPARGEGWNKVHVVAIHDAEPNLGFDTRAILGKVEAEPAPQGDLLGEERRA